MTEPCILIVGCGPGSPEFLTPAARRAVDGADVVVGPARLLGLFAGAGVRRVVVDGVMDQTLARIDECCRAGRRVAALVSGDPGLFSLARAIVRRFGRERCRVIPGVSAVQAAFASVGLDWSDARIVSAHARNPDVTAADLARHDKIAILAGTARSMEWIAGLATTLGPGYTACICENLTLPDERVRRVPAPAVADCPAASRAIVLLVRSELLA